MSIGGGKGESGASCAWVTGPGSSRQTGMPCWASVRQWTMAPEGGPSSGHQGAANRPQHVPSGGQRNPCCRYGLPSALPDGQVSASARAASHTAQSCWKLPLISATASPSVIWPAIQLRAAFPKMVRPTAKPLTSGCRAASAKLAASSSCGASRPSTTIPRVRGSLRVIASTACCQASSVLNGSSFHQSGKIPAS